MVLNQDRLLHLLAKLLAHRLHFLSKCRCILKEALTKLLMEFLRLYFAQIIIIPIIQADYPSSFQLLCYHLQDSQVQSIPHYKLETSLVQQQQVYLAMEIEEFDWKVSLTLSAALGTYPHLKDPKENTTKWWIKLMRLSKMLQPTEMRTVLW